MKKPRLVSAVCEKLAQEVAGIAAKGWMPLTLGGDHSLVSERAAAEPRSVSFGSLNDDLGDGYGIGYKG